MLIDRRFLLRSAVPALAAAALHPASAFAAAKKPSARRSTEGIVDIDFSVHDVNGLTLFQVAGCNVVGLPGPDGALLIDGGPAIFAPFRLKTWRKALRPARSTP